MQIFLENKAISNNVFKIALKQECSLDKKDFIAFFTDENGEIISNKKKIVTGNLGDETTLGFVLDSGIDYTKMKKCFMKITTEYDEIQTFEFKMNIAFYSDF